MIETGKNLSLPENEDHDTKKYKKHINDLIEDAEIEAEMEAWEEQTTKFLDGLTLSFFALVILGFISRFVWLQLQKRKAVLVVRYDTGTRVKVAPGTLLLEASRFAGVPHASACGGAGRCSTCRTRVLVGHENLPPPENKESKVNIT